MPFFSLHSALPTSYSAAAALCSMLLAAAASAQAPEPAAAPPRSIAKERAPGWVKSYEVDFASAPEAEEVGGSWYTLIERQDDARSHTTYLRYGVRLINESGVQENSQLTVSWDPSFQTLCFHKLVIHRVGEVIDRLPSQEFKIIQRETNHDRQLYDSRLSALAVIEDVRAGDTLEYAYSIAGANPVFEGRFSATYATTWAVPVAHLRLRLLWHGGRKLRWKAFNTELQPETRQRDDHVEYEWAADGVPATLADDGLPSSYDPYGKIRISDYKSWEEVKSWARKQYEQSDEGEAGDDLPAELEEKVGEIAALATKEKQVLAALRHAQDDFRYVGDLEGIHSYRPHSLETICRRRFGDCKDKSLLLTALLRKLGFEAYPALVDTRYRAAIEDWLPTPAAFNHVVVEVFAGGRAHWLDATVTHGRGSLADMYFPPYGRALVARAGAQGLTRVPGNGLAVSRTEITETYRLEDYAGEATLGVTTRYHGAEADTIRFYFAAGSWESIAKSYLDFYSTDYPQIELQAPLEIEDDEERNVVTVKESYRISGLWQPQDDDEERVEASFYARSLDGTIALPSARIRTMPLAISYPKKVDQTIEIHFPSRLTFEKEALSIENPAFNFRYEERLSGRSFLLICKYEALKDRVEAAAIGQYLKDVERASETTSSTIWIPRSYQEAVPPDEHLAGGSSADNEPFVPNWPVFLIAFFVIILAAIGAVLAVRWNPPFRPDPYPDPILSGIRGWLILVAIGVVLGPPTRVMMLGWLLYEAGDLTTWVALTTPGEEAYHPLWQPALLAELALAAIFLVYSILLLVLFFKKKYTLPRLMVYFYLFNFVAGAGLYLLFRGIPAMDEEVLSEYGSHVGRAGVFGLLWGAYFLRSKRVKATFTRGAPTGGEPFEEIHPKEDPLLLQ